MCVSQASLTKQIRKRLKKKTVNLLILINSQEAAKVYLTLLKRLTLKIQRATDTEAERGNEGGFPCFLLNCKASRCVKDTRLITLIVAYFHGNSAPSGNLASLANDTERVIILAPG